MATQVMKFEKQIRYIKQILLDHPDNWLIAERAAEKLGISERSLKRMAKEHPEIVRYRVVGYRQDGTSIKKGHIYNIRVILDKAYHGIGTHNLYV